MNGPASVDRKTVEETPRVERLTVAALRRAEPLRLWGGKGCGIPCDFCRVLLTDTEVEYEVDARLDSQPLTLHFHPRCYDIWKTESEAASTEGVTETDEPPRAKASP